MMENTFAIIKEYPTHSRNMMARKKSPNHAGYDRYDGKPLKRLGNQDKANP
jgi:hypothetical protein